MNYPGEEVFIVTVRDKNGEDIATLANEGGLLHRHEVPAPCPRDVLSRRVGSIPVDGHDVNGIPFFLGPVRPVPCSHLGFLLWRNHLTSIMTLSGVMRVFRPEGLFHLPSA
jgi:hypothetical protein